jgi:hypothetical protein
VVERFTLWVPELRSNYPVPLHLFVKYSLPRSATVVCGSGDCALLSTCGVLYLCSIIVAEVTKVSPNKRLEGGTRFNSLESGGL